MGVECSVGIRNVLRENKKQITSFDISRHYIIKLCIVS